MKPYNISLKFGIITGVILIVYFLVLGFLNVNSNPFYSLVNGVIMVSALSLTMRDLEDNSKQKIGYKKGFEVLFLAGLIATVIFSIFFITYYVYAPRFSEALLKNIGDFANTGLVFITVVTMGVVTSMVVAFALMQLHKNRLRKSEILRAGESSSSVKTRENEN